MNAGWAEIVIAIITTVGLIIVTFITLRTGRGVRRVDFAVNNTAEGEPKLYDRIVQVHDKLNSVHGKVNSVQECIGKVQDKLTNVETKVDANAANIHDVIFPKLEVISSQHDEVVIPGIEVIASQHEDVVIPGIERLQEDT
jgi:predicted  nucleic acid-binding Zn-ribbon protein